MHLPLELLEGCTQLIETGTGAGDGIHRALKAGVPLIYSIDLSSEVHAAACVKFTGHPNLHILCGSSPDVLREIIMPQPGTVFFLDAHYSGGLWSNTIDARYGQCPLLEELRVIRSFAWNEPPLIIVDDADFFNPAWSGWGRYKRADWPTVDEIAQAVEPWPVWLYGLDLQSENDDSQLIIGKSREELGG